MLEPVVLVAVADFHITVPVALLVELAVLVGLK